jgi:hypothetical protein
MNEMEEKERERKKIMEMKGKEEEYMKKKIEE